MPITDFITLGEYRVNAANIVTIRHSTEGEVLLRFIGSNEELAMPGDVDDVTQRADDAASGRNRGTPNDPTQPEAPV